MIDKNIYDKIVDIFNQSFEDRTPKIRTRGSYEIVGGKTLLIDVPKKSKLHYHSSSYEIECDENRKLCRTEGMLTTDLNRGNNVKKDLENLSCNVLAIHDHDGITIKSTHIHFRCEEKSYEDTLSISRFIGKF